MPARSSPHGPSGLGDVFDNLKSVLSRYASGFSVHTGRVKNKRDYHLILEKPVVIDGRKKKELWFASVIQQKASVGFYFLPVYFCPEVKAKLVPELLKHLDGKGCFHFKSLDPGWEKQVDGALKAGLGAYRKRKWL